ncbi:MAG: efflux RND transporter periplasmic adaptor subunit [Bacteroidia bacterium]|nr:efflux RND transporter periplasmic adaptor subunit [Bacteroidia bacterium]
MKKTIIWISAAAVITGLIILLRPADRNAPKGPQPKGKAVAVEAVKIKTVNAENVIRVSGNIMASEEVNLQSQIAGVVTKIGFAEGSRVHKGDLLLQIDDSPYQAQLKKDIATKELYQVTLDRTKKLLDINGVAQQDYDVAESNLKGINADIELIKVSIDYCSITAPFDGIVGLKNISIGSYINTGTVIADFEQLDPVKIDFYIPEKYSPLIKAGDSIQFNVAGNNKPFTGRVYALDPKIDQTTGGLHIRAFAANKTGELLPGGFANIILPLRHAAGAIMIPSEAVIPKVIGQDVYIDKGGIAALVPVELGIRTDSSVEVTKGLNAGDTLIVRGSMMIYPGSKLTISMFK